MKLWILALWMLFNWPVEINPESQRLQLIAHGCYISSHKYYIYIVLYHFLHRFSQLHLSFAPQLSQSAETERADRTVLMVRLRAANASISSWTLMYFGGQCRPGHVQFDHIFNSKRHPSRPTRRAKFLHTAHTLHLYNTFLVRYHHGHSGILLAFQQCISARTFVGESCFGGWSTSTNTHQDTKYRLELSVKRN